MSPGTGQQPAVGRVRALAAMQASAAAGATRLQRDNAGERTHAPTAGPVRADAQIVSDEPVRRGRVYSSSGVAAPWKESRPPVWSQLIRTSLSLEGTV